MKKLRVLLVDDEIIIREGFKRLFDWDAHDCEVAGEAADGMEALSRIDTLDPDLVIMDINIPILNGLKVIQLSRIKHPETAFIIVSGYDDFSYCREALRLQITDYILKPVNYEEFGACIDRLKISLFQKWSVTITDSAFKQLQLIMHAFLTLYHRNAVHHFSKSKNPAVMKVRSHIFSSKSASIIINGSSRNTGWHHHKYICFHIFCLIQNIINSCQTGHIG